MDETTEARRAALRRFIQAEGGYGVVAKKFELDTSRMSYLYQLIAHGSTAAFGERSARKWQEIFKMEGDPLLHPRPDPESSGPTISLEETIKRLGDFLRAVPPDQREVIASVISAYARRPVTEVGVALVTLLSSQDL